jgi:methionine-rich copper-binding protein CopC
MLRAMLPISSSKGTLGSLTKAGAPITYTTELIKGTQYAIFPATTGAYAATYAADTTAPTITSTMPATNTTNVATTASVTATFSEAIDPATLTSATVTLRDANGNLIAGAINYDAASKTVSLTPTAALASNSTYTASVRGGSSDPRVKDLAGNALASSLSWSFTTGAPTALSLWSTNALPSITAANDPAAVELGVRFTSDAAGTITGIRFYKGAANTGTHTVTLWNSAGAAIATATAGSETASGWQTVLFPAPVAISANTTYTASYFAPNGNYAADGNYFAAAYNQGPLHAAGGSNGVYQYGGGYPTSSYNSTN